MSLVDLLFGFKGRLSRTKFLVTGLAYGLVVGLIIIAVTFSMGVNLARFAETKNPADLPIGSSIFALIVFVCLMVLGLWVNTALLKKRFNDTGKFHSLAYVNCGIHIFSLVASLTVIGLVIALPLNLANVVIFLMALFWSPSPGENQYGPNPRDPNAMAAYRDTQEEAFDASAFDDMIARQLAENEARAAHKNAPKQKNWGNQPVSSQSVSRYGRNPISNPSPGGRPSFGRRGG